MQTKQEQLANMSVSPEQIVCSRSNRLVIEIIVIEIMAQDLKSTNRIKLARRLPELENFEVYVHQTTEHCKANRLSAKHVTAEQ